MLLNAYNVFTGDPFLVVDCPRDVVRLDMDEHLQPENMKSDWEREHKDR
jgi:hypothetical protein